MKDYGEKFVDVHTINLRLDATLKEMKERLQKGGEQLGTELVDYARANHRWQVRTGNTNEATIYTVVDDKDSLTVYLIAQMYYDIFLELAHNGQYAWIWPTILAFRARALQIFVESLQA